MILGLDYASRDDPSKGLRACSSRAPAGEIPAVDLLDIAPTVLERLGLPIPSDMLGRFIEANPSKAQVR